MRISASLSEGTVSLRDQISEFLSHPRRIYEFLDVLWGSSSKQLLTHVLINKYTGLKDDTGPQSQCYGLVMEGRWKHSTNEVGFVINIENEYVFKNK